MKFLLFSILLLISLTVNSQPFGYTYSKEITIPGAMVSGSHTNFPLLFSVTDNSLRTVANGGRVTNNNGYDIIFTTVDCQTILEHQIETYNPMTGEYIAWVQIPTLTGSTNTVFQMYYGNSSVTTSTSSTAVWDANYKAVWHFNNSVGDNSSNGNNLVDNVTSNWPASKIGNGRNLNNTSNILSSNSGGQHLKIPNEFLAGMSDFTFEGWVLLDRSDTNWERIFDFGQNTTINFFFTPSVGTASLAQTSSKITIGGNAGEQGSASGSISNAGSWVHWAVVLNSSSSSMSIYRNGVALAEAIGTVSRRPTDMEPSTANYFGRSLYSADHFIDAKFDEFRISSSARSAGWITTSYNNQNTPSTFYSISGESDAETLCSVLPVEMSFFGARQVNKAIEIEWTTLSELNNNYFAVDRSRDGVQWNTLVTIPGAGTSLEKNQYSFTDDKLNKSGRYFYRVRQVDYNGTFTNSKIVTVNFSGNGIPIVYTVSSRKQLVVELNHSHDFKVLF